MIPPPAPQRPLKYTKFDVTTGAMLNSVNVVADTPGTPDSVDAMRSM